MRTSAHYETALDYYRRCIRYEKRHPSAHELARVLGVAISSAYIYRNQVIQALGLVPPRRTRPKPAQFYVHRMRILFTIHFLTQRHGKAPTYNEIADEANVSLATTVRHVLSMVDAGILQFDARKRARAIVIPPETKTAYHLD